MKSVQKQMGRRVTASQGTIDPSQINDPSQIPPPGAQFVGLSPQGQVEVSCGTIPGDVDAEPAAKELMSSGLDTSGLSNADYVYNQVSALYGNQQLPSFRSPSGNNVKSLVFVSGSSQGGYGAFHDSGSGQADFDRIVTDSLTVSGNYSAGSGLGTAMALIKFSGPHLFSAFHGPGDLLRIFRSDDTKLETASPAAISEAHGVACQSILALGTAVECGAISATPRQNGSHSGKSSKREELARRLLLTNREIPGLVRAAAATGTGRQYLSTALFAAEIVESFQMLTGKGDPGKTDGEAVSRVLAYKITPEISLIPGFNSGITQQWWKDGHPDYVNVNSQDDQSTDGNAAGVMFLLFMNDFLGVALDQILQHMPSNGGAPLGQTYVNLLKDYPALSQAAGQDGKSAFQKMVALLQQNAGTSNGLLNLPANGNPFPAMPGSAQGGLFAEAQATSGSLTQDAQTAIGLEGQLEQELASVKSALQQIQAQQGAPAALKAAARPRAAKATSSGNGKTSFSYGPPLVGSVLANLAQQVAGYRAPQYDQALQQEFWPHVYNELPGTGTNTDRLQVITGTNQAPVALQLTGTITQTKAEPDGDLHIAFQPDDPGFPTNHSGTEPPLELEIIYAGPVTQADAKQAEQGYTNPFDVSQLKAGVHIQVAGPLIFDRSHGRVDASGNVQYGLEIHPVAGLTILTGPPHVPLPATPPQPVNPAPAGQLSSDLAAAIAQVASLSQTVSNLTALLQKMQAEAPKS